MTGELMGTRSKDQESLHKKKKTTANSIISRRLVPFKKTFMLHMDGRNL
jgi:hypothetical protein